MRFGSIKYLFKQGAKNAYLNKAMSFASVGVLTACLVIVGSALLISMNINNIIKSVQQQNEIVAYLDDDLEPGRETQIDSMIRSIPNVSEVEYISKEQAFVNQKEKLGDLLEGYENENVFPASYRIKVDNVETIDDDIKKIENISGIYKVDAPTDIIEIMLKADKAISFSGTAVIIALLIVSLVIIINTIKLTVFSRRREIGIMKCVGATNGFIRFPFVVEGIILGIISAIIAFLIVFYIYSTIYNSVVSDMSTWVRSASGTIIKFKSVAPWLVISYLGAGIAVGAFGSALSMRKHLKV